MDAVASASLDALLEDFAGSDPGLVAIVERFKVSSIVHCSCSTCSCRSLEIRQCLIRDGDAARI